MTRFIALIMAALFAVGVVLAATSSANPPPVHYRADGDGPAVHYRA